MELQSGSTVKSDDAKREAERAIADRLTTIGTLATAVAHELNNPLAYVETNVVFAREAAVRLASRLRGDGAAPSVEEASAALDEIANALGDARIGAERVRRIVRDLNVFSRADDGPSGAVDLHDVLELSIRMAYNEIRHRARFTRALAPVPLVQGSEARLGQIFVNLLVNAAQAIPEGRVQENEIAVATFATDGGTVVAEVRDTGSGIAPEHLPRIFDPFFTTKPKGLGTGLGLAICKEILGEIGGRISVQSAVGTGSTFRVELRHAEGKPAAPKARSVPPAGLGRPRVLVVDDEPMLARAVRRMLEPRYEVTALTSPQEAVARLAGGDRFDAILCDLMMPEMSGFELYERIERTAPELADRVVFMTGGAFTPRAREFLAGHLHRHLEKPFEASALRALVAELTEGTRATNT